MIKKFLALLCALGLLLCALPALAEAPSPVYALALRAADGTLTYTGTAVLMGDSSTLITTRWAVPEGELMALGNGERLAVAAAEAPFAGSDLRTLTLAEPADAVPAVPGAISNPLMYIACGPEGIFTQEAAHLTLTGYEGEACLLFTGAADALPGAVLFNEAGDLAGMVVASYGEGMARYAAYPGELIQARMAGEAPVTASDDSGRWLKDFTLSAHAGVLALDWSAVPQPEDPDAPYVLIWGDAANPYISYAEMVWGEDTGFIPVIPGRSYHVWLQQASAEDMESPASRQQAVSYTVPEQQRYTEHAFRDVSMYLGAAAAEVADNTVVPALENITWQALTDPSVRYYLQVESTYQVTEELEANLVIALFAPDGTVYADLSGFIFLPELNESDVWHADVTELLSSCMEFSQGVPGEYRLCYYLDGLLANEMDFTLE